MSYVLETGLPQADLEAMTKKALESLQRPGVAVEIPASMVQRIEGALQGLISEQLLHIREQGRSMPSETLEFRVR